MQIQSIKEIIDGPAISPYTGSANTFNLVAKQIEKRWGKSEVKNYDPYKNALTFKSWIKLGYRVKKGEKAIRSITFVEVEDAQGNIVKRVPRTVFLFYYRQVEKINDK